MPVGEVRRAIMCRIVEILSAGEPRQVFDTVSEAVRQIVEISLGFYCRLHDDRLQWIINGPYDQLIEFRARGPEPHPAENERLGTPVVRPQLRKNKAGDGIRGQ